MKLKIHITKLAALLPFISNDETRCVINGLHVKVANKRATYEASDGRRLVRYSPDLIAEGEGEFILPRWLLRAASATFEGAVIVEHKNDLVTISPETGHAIEIRSAGIGGNYPTFDKIIPDPIPTTFDGEGAVFNAQYLAEFAALIDALIPGFVGVRVVRVNPNAGDPAPIIAQAVSKHDTLIVMLMGMRT